MNKVILIGRCVAEPETRYTQGQNSMAVSRYRLAVDRKFKRDNEPTADFVSCVAFSKQAEFAEKYLRKGTKICVTGRIQTGSYKNKDGQTVYTTDVVVEEHEFVESKASESNSGNDGGRSPYGQASNDGFMDFSDGIDEQLPFV